MKIRDLMQKDLVTCGLDATAADAALLMEERNCGILPVVSPEDGSLRGLVTDRDLCLAARRTGVPLSAFSVERAMHPATYVCRETDDVRRVHELLREHQIHRIPVVDEADKVIGIISLTDLARWAEKRAARHDMAALADVGRTLARICQPRVGESEKAPSASSGAMSG